MTGTTFEVIVRATVVLGPVLAVIALTRRERPGLRARGAALLGTVAALVGIVLLNVLAAHAGWWRFEANTAMVTAQPLDLVLAWAVLWGAVPVLAPRVPLRDLLVGFAALDLMTMPLVPGLSLGRSWAVGEAVAIALVALPAALLGRWTAERRHLHGRAALQVSVCALLWLGVAPAAAGSLEPLTVRTGAAGWLGLQVGVLGALLALPAVWELVHVGQGTPWPWDPPRRVVTTGPYRYVRNPMQLGGVLLLVGEAIVLSSWWLLAFAATGAAFAATSARVHEDAAIAARHPDAWPAFRASVPAWVPRWRPAPHGPAATLWVAAGCGTCDDVGRWVAGRRPTSLTVRPAEEHPSGALRRARHEPAGGSAGGPPEDGVAAFARACEHLSLPWMLVGSFLRLPVVRAMAATIGDLVGFGPRVLDATTATCTLPGPVPESMPGPGRVAADATRTAAP